MTRPWNTCADCGAMNRTLIFTVTERGRTKQIGTCCYDPSREAEPSAKQASRATSAPPPAGPRAGEQGGLRL